MLQVFFTGMVFAGDVRKKVSCNSHVLHSMYNMSVTVIQNMVSIDSVTNMISISVTDMLEIDCNTWMLQLIYVGNLPAQIQPIYR